MTGEKKNLLENFLSLGALQIFSYVIPLFSLPYLSRVLGAELFGLVFFAQAFMVYFIMLTDYGFGLSAVREIAINRHNQNNISSIYNAVMTVKFILVGISFICLLLAIALIPRIHDNSLIFLITFLMVIGNAIYPVWFFQGMERMKYITFLNILSKVIFLILIFIFVKHKSDYILVPILNSFGFIVSGLLGQYFAFKEFGIKLYIPKKKTLKKQFKYSTTFFLSRASVSLYTNTNSFCLGLISSNIMVGYYVAAEKIYQAISGLVSPLTSALYPFIAKYRDIKLYKKVFLLTVCINTFVCIFIYIYAPQIMSVFYGKELIKAFEILRIFCFIPLVSIPHMMLGFPLLGALGYTKEVNVSIIISSFIHITGLTILYLIGKMNIYSIAYMVLVTESFILLLRTFWVIKYKLLNTEGMYIKNK